jgi:endonuclease YncB( thermonuclease family)
MAQEQRSVGAAALAIALLAASPAHGRQCERATLAGAVTHVRDGDPIEVAGRAIRLNGLAAPEGDDPGGAEATRVMRKMVDGRQIRCELDGKRNHDRCVAVCYLEGQDISEVMVRRGLARDCPRFSGGRYRAAEAQAAAAGATIGGSYALPSYCRRR